jgi:hypothetical protein
MVLDFICLGLCLEGLNGYFKARSLDEYRIDITFSLADYTYRSTHTTTAWVINL